ncbi:MAG: hypothetical protein Q7O66_19755 [Dehalococcoidia bacterium]|nr:hypothetical protein [Dehalococcoidia bacterium]
MKGFSTVYLNEKGKQSDTQFRAAIVEELDEIRGHLKVVSKILGEILQLQRLTAKEAAPKPDMTSLDAFNQWQKRWAEGIGPLSVRRCFDRWGSRIRTTHWDAVLELHIDCSPFVDGDMFGLDGEVTSPDSLPEPEAWIATVATFADHKSALKAHYYIPQVGEKGWADIIAACRKHVAERKSC